MILSLDLYLSEPGVETPLDSMHPRNTLNKVVERIGEHGSFKTVIDAVVVLGCPLGVE